MAWSIKGTAITLTRGDSFSLQINLKVNGEDYVPYEGDIVTFRLKRNMMDSKHTRYLDEKPFIQKRIPSNTMILDLIPADTKKLPFGTYVYDLEITFGVTGQVYTFINNAIFNIVPEV